MRANGADDPRVKSNVRSYSETRTLSPSQPINMFTDYPVIRRHRPNGSAGEKHGLFDVAGQPVHEKLTTLKAILQLQTSKQRVAENDSRRIGLVLRDRNVEHVNNDLASLPRVTAMSEIDKAWHRGFSHLRDWANSQPNARDAFHAALDAPLDKITLSTIGDDDDSHGDDNLGTMNAIVRCLLLVGSQTAIPPVQLCIQGESGDDKGTMVPFFPGLVASKCLHGVYGNFDARHGIVHAGNGILVDLEQPLKFTDAIHRSIEHGRSPAWVRAKDGTERLWPSDDLNIATNTGALKIHWRYGDDGTVTLRTLALTCARAASSVGRCWFHPSRATCWHHINTWTSLNWHPGVKEDMGTFAHAMLLLSGELPRNNGEDEAGDDVVRQRNQEVTDAITSVSAALAAFVLNLNKS